MRIVHASHGTKMNVNVTRINPIAKKRSVAKRRKSLRNVASLPNARIIAAPKITNRAAVAKSSMLRTYSTLKIRAALSQSLIR